MIRKFIIMNKADKIKAIKELIFDLEVSISKHNAYIVFFNLDCCQRKEVIRRLPNSIKKQIHISILNDFLEQKTILEKGVITMNYNLRLLRQKAKNIHNNE